MRLLKVRVFCGLAAAATVSIGAGACGGGSAAGGPPGGFPPSGVKTVTLVERPIAQSSEYVGTVQSLRSITIQPQVEGLLTRIFVKSGDRVRAGAPLAQIDPDRAAASVSSLEANRAARQADVAYAKQQLDRVTALLQAGAVSQQEVDQAETAYKTAVAQLGAIDAQIRSGRVELAYYRVTALTAGIVGDIPVRVGDRVTTSTVITTIDESRGLELHMSVPLEQSVRLATGLPVEILDPDGKVLATTTVSFIAPRAQDETQSVLVKAELPPNSPFRVLQYVRSRIVWNTTPALAIPVVAVSRISGAYFVFVVEQKDKGFVARQRAVQLGEVNGDEYVVRSGLKPGERIITSGIQKLADGVPVAPEA